MIGLLVLIGIVKKDAVMMIDVALTTQHEGKDTATAIYEAVLLRFALFVVLLIALAGIVANRGSVRVRAFSTGGCQAGTR